MDNLLLITPTICSIKSPHHKAILAVPLFARRSPIGYGAPSYITYTLCNFIPTHTRSTMIWDNGFTLRKILTTSATFVQKTGHILRIKILHFCHQTILSFRFEALPISCFWRTSTRCSQHKVELQDPLCCRKRGDAFYKPPVRQG